MSDNRWGKLFRCPNFPSSEDRDRIERLRKMSNLGSFSSKTFENFELARKGYTPREKASLEVVFKGALAFAREPKGWLLLEGGYGCGKTHLASAIGNARLSAGDTVLFLTAPDLLDHLRATYGSSSDVGYDELFDRVKNVQLLILDDLGTENPSAWAQEKLFQLLNHRYVAQLPTVITTNARLERLDPRLTSRLKDMAMSQHLVIDAPDYRNDETKKLGKPLSQLYLYDNYTFETLDVTHHLLHEERHNLGKAVRIAMDYSQSPKGWLLLMGGNGTGKTHIACAIAHVREKHYKDDCIFIGLSDLLDYLKTTFHPESERSFGSLLDEIRSVEFLVLDDVGADSGKTWAQEKLFQILDYRYVSRLPTVITTAQPLESLHPRLTSRLLDDRLCYPFTLTVQPYAFRRKKRPQ